MTRDDPSYQLWLRVDAACDRFEAAWQAGVRPDLAAFAADVPAAERGPLVLALVRVDAEFRRKVGEHPTSAEYRARFPDLDPLELDRAVCDPMATGAVPPTHSPAYPDTTQALLPNIPGYRVTAEIARGGMGRVLAARDLTFDREVAIKVLRPDLTAEEAGRRFVRESKITARLSHPGIPPVHALGTLADGSPFLAMKLVRGQTLAALLAGEDRDRTDPIRVFEQIGEAVGFAHQHRVIHRDLKPHNVMVGEFGEVQVMDWGLAKSEDGDQRADDDPDATVPWRRGGASGPGVDSDLQTPNADETQPGSVFGTIPYMPPEQARGEVERVGTRSDVFSLGGILCTILTGKPPYAGRPVRALLTMAQNADLGEAIARLDGCGADPELVALAKRCLAKDPAARPADGKAVADAVADYRAGAERRLRRAERDRAAAEARAVEQRKKRRVQLALAAAVGIGVVGAVAVAWRWEVRTEREEFARKQTEEAQRIETARLEAAQQGELERRDAKRREVERHAAEERTTQEKQARTGVAAALHQSEELRKQYRFTEATRAMGSAEQLAAGGLTPDLADAVAVAKADLRFVIRLDEIRMRRSVWIPDPGGKGTADRAFAPPAYRKAFRERGLDPTAGDPAAVAARIKDSPVRPELVAALDDWAVFELDVPTRDAVLAVLRLADPGPWLNRFRAPATQTDAEKLAAVAAEADPLALPPAVVVALGELMKQHRLDPTPILTAALTRHPDDFLIAFSLGMWSMTRNKPEAVGYYRAARALRPENAMVVTHLGIALDDGGDPDGAIAAFRESLRLQANDPVTHVFLALALKKKDDLEGAIGHLRTAVRLDPDNAMVHLILGITLHEADDPKGAVEAFLAASKLKPDDPRPWSAIGLSRTKLRDRAGASEAFRKAVELGSTEPVVYVYLANDLKEKGDVPGAIRLYRKAIKFAPDDAKLYALLGVALNANDDADGAVAAYRKSIELDPKEPRVHAVLGLALRDRDDLDGAVRHLREAVKLGLKNPQVEAELEDLEGRKGRRDDAVRRKLGVAVPDE
jgi:Flp pilus assembly protein TadD